MANPDPAKQAVEVPKHIFRQFLDELKTNGLPEDLIQRLDKVLLSGNSITETAVKGAIFNDAQNL